MATTVAMEAWKTTKSSTWTRERRGPVTSPRPVPRPVLGVRAIRGAVRVRTDLVVGVVLGVGTVLGLGAGAGTRERGKRILILLLGLVRRS